MYIFLLPKEPNIRVCRYYEYIYIMKSVYCIKEKQVCLANKDSFIKYLARYVAVKQNIERIKMQKSIVKHGISIFLLQLYTVIDYILIASGSLTFKKSFRFNFIQNSIQNHSLYSFLIHK